MPEPYYCSSILAPIREYYSTGFLKNARVVETGYTDAAAGALFLNTKYLYPTKFQMNVTSIPATGATISTHNFVSGPTDFTNVATATFAAHR